MQNMINTITNNTMTNINIPSFRDKAITVRLRRAMYIPTKYDSAATAAAESSFGAGNVGRYTKRLLKNCGPLKDVQKAFQDVYTYVIDHTLPWMDEGVRVLPNASYVDFAQEVGALRRKALPRGTHAAQGGNLLAESVETDLLLESSRVNHIGNLHPVTGPQRR